MAGAVAFDRGGTATEAYPFAAHDMAAGDPVADADVAWRDVPTGILPPPQSVLGHATRAISNGDPLLAGAVAAVEPAPPQWWAVELPLPQGVAPGAEVQVVVLDPAMSSEGLVVAAPVVDALSGRSVGLVAVPEGAAVIVARAAVADSVTVLVRP
jgi:SAF domain